MAQIRIKRTTNTLTDTQKQLLPGELGLVGNNLYYGQASTTDSTKVSPTLVAIQNGPNTFTGNNRFGGNNTFTGANAFNQLPTVNGKNIALSTDVPKIKSIKIKYGTNSSSTGNLVEAYSGQGEEEIALNVYAKSETYSQTEVDNAISNAITNGVEYKGTVNSLSELHNAKLGKGDFVRVSTSFAMGNETAHVGDVIIATNDNPTNASTTNMGGYDLIHTEIDSNTWTANSKSAAGYVAAGGSNKGTMWITDNDGNPGWSNVFQFGTRPRIAGSSYDTTGSELLMRGEYPIQDIDITLSSGDVTDAGNYSIALNPGQSWQVGTGGAQDLTVRNDNNTVKTYLPANTYVTNADGSTTLLSDFGGAIKSITLNGVAATISGSTAALTYNVPVATNGALGGISIGYTPTSTTPRNYAVQLSADNKAYVNVPWQATALGASTVHATNGGVGITWTSSTANNTTTYTPTVGVIDCGKWS